jgi:NADH:ubiquinone oxidoreductase subunit 4 (subunit M)
MFILILSNIAFPGTINFVGELLIIIGAWKCSNIIIFLSTFGMVITLIYSLSLYSKIWFGPIQIYFIRYYSECTRLEFISLFIFPILIIICGLIPHLIFSYNIWLYEINLFI